MPPTYTHGHHDSVLRSHRWRTAENSAGYLLPHLAAGQRLLDVGCGPGTITVDLAARIAPGPVVGLDASSAVLGQAVELARRRAEAPASIPTGAPTPGRLAFVVGDVGRLPFADSSFDVVHAHQVLQHLTDPVGALAEMRRVLAPAGLLAVRDSDYASFTWWPADPSLTRWMELYHQVTARTRADADAGRSLLSWTNQAGFTQPTVTASAWVYADPESRRWWGGLWADRVRHSAFADQALAYGLSEPAELGAIAAAFRRWSRADDGCFVVPSVEVLARR